MRSSCLTVEREGVLTLPAEVCEAARLRPGDILAVEPLGESLVVEVYRELLDGAWELMDDRALRDLALRECRPRPPAFSSMAAPSSPAWSGQGIHPHRVAVIGRVAYNPPASLP